MERARGMARLRFQAGGRALATLARFLTAEAALNKVLFQLQIPPSPGAARPIAMIVFVLDVALLLYPGSS